MRRVTLSGLIWLCFLIQLSCNAKSRHISPSLCKALKHQELCRLLPSIRLSWHFLFKRCACLIIDATGNTLHLLNHQSVFRDDARVLQGNCRLFSTFFYFLKWCRGHLENRTHGFISPRKLGRPLCPRQRPLFHHVTLFHVLFGSPWHQTDKAAPAAALIRKNVYQQMLLFQQKQMAHCD